MATKIDIRIEDRITRKDGSALKFVVSAGNVEVWVIGTRGGEGTRPSVRFTWDEWVAAHTVTTELRSSVDRARKAVAP